MEKSWFHKKGDDAEDGDAGNGSPSGGKQGSGKPRLFTEKFRAGKRTYFFDVYQTSGAGEKYIRVTESKRTGEDSYDHNQVMVFPEDMVKFQRAFQKAMEFIVANPG